MNGIDLTENNAFIKPEENQMNNAYIKPKCPSILLQERNKLDNSDDLVMDNDAKYNSDLFVCGVCHEPTNPISDFENMYELMGVSSIFICKNCRNEKAKIVENDLEIKPNDVKMDFNLLSVLM